MALLTMVKARNFSSCILSSVKRGSIVSRHCSRCTSVVKNYHTPLFFRPKTDALGYYKSKLKLHCSTIRQCQVNFTSSVGPKRCWKCQSKSTSETVFCLSCKSLQPLNKQQDHFSVLGIQKNFNIDTKALAKRFKMLQAQFHPDRYTLRAEREQQFAHEHSSAVNKAYRCLLHPVNRAVYLLDLAGQPLHEGQVDLSSAFLMEVMEMNEELAEARDRNTIQDIGQRNMTILDSLLSEADVAFSSNDIDKARVVVAKIKYYNSIYEKVVALEREHGIIE